MVVHAEPCIQFGRLGWQTVLTSRKSVNRVEPQGSINTVLSTITVRQYFRRLCKFTLVKINLKIPIKELLSLACCPSMTILCELSKVWYFIQFLKFVVTCRWWILSPFMFSQKFFDHLLYDYNFIPPHLFFFFSCLKSELFFSPLEILRSVNQLNYKPLG